MSSNICATLTASSPAAAHPAGSYVFIKFRIRRAGRRLETPLRSESALSVVASQRVHVHAYAHAARVRNASATSGVTSLSPGLRYDCSHRDDLRSLRSLRSLVRSIGAHLIKLLLLLG